MRRPGVPAALLAASACLTMLAGCTKPVPSVTIQSGGTSLRSEPVQYKLDGKLRTNNSGAKVLTVRPGDIVNISVDKATRDAGWVVVLGGAKASPVIEDAFAYTLAVPSFNGVSDAPLAVFQQPPAGGEADGAWVFTLHQNI
ncbi:MAG: hypothetical protein QOJ32_2292 [Frankiaceae bacterium]|jgi:hypothetical protein|nr:hypothetical protein [Frankiaceae bacterium]MDQ1648168.1 hypothetical protein [Frankiaceae bacterium]